MAQEAINQKYPLHAVGKNEFINLIYAVMIYEDFNRPKHLRRIENLFMHILPYKRKLTLGIMQVTTDKPLTDEESILFAVDRLLKVYKAALHGSLNSSSSCNSSYLPWNSASLKLFNRLQIFQNPQPLPFHSRRASPSRRPPRLKKRNSIHKAPLLSIAKALHATLESYNGSSYADEVYQVYQEISNQKAGIP